MAHQSDLKVQPMQMTQAAEDALETLRLRVVLCSWVTSYRIRYGCEPHSVEKMNYLFGMAKTNWKQVIWTNVQTRMESLYGGENLNRLIKDSHVGNGTITRLKEQETSVGIDVIEKVAVRRVAESLLMQAQGNIALSDSVQQLQTNVLDDRARQALDALFQEPIVLPPDGD